MIISVIKPMQRPVSPNMSNPGNFHLPVRAHVVDCSMCLDNFAPNSLKSGNLCQDWYKILFPRQPQVVPYLVQKVLISFKG